jgi:hypothetical protein
VVTAFLDQGAVTVISVFGRSGLSGNDGVSDILVISVVVDSGFGSISSLGVVSTISVHFFGVSSVSAFVIESDGGSIQSTLVDVSVSSGISTFSVSWGSVQGNDFWLVVSDNLGSGGDWSLLGDNGASGGDWSLSDNSGGSDWSLSDNGASCGGWSLSNNSWVLNNNLAGLNS